MCEKVTAQEFRFGIYWLSPPLLSSSVKILFFLAWGLAASQAADFSADIRPILETSCQKCHGGAVQLSKLHLRPREAALKGGVRGAAIVPGKPQESRMYRVVAGLEKPAMPMDGKLSAAQIEAIREWIAQ